MKIGSFNGLPAFIKPLWDRIKKLDILQGFLPVELCNLDYHPERGSGIDPHQDDFWLWGERLLIINLCSPTKLTFLKNDNEDVQVAVLLPRRSLLVISSDARNEWKHAIHREDITERRVSIGLRELTPEFLPGGENEQFGKDILDIAMTFNGISV